MTDPTASALRLTDLPVGGEAVITAIEARAGSEAVTGRLRDLGFVADEPVRVVARAPFGGPLVVQIGFTRFALRREEAARVLVADAP